jgi:hypothetical protein
MLTAPWLLWGNQKTLECEYTGIFSSTRVSQQLNRIAYKRPESWHWLFSARIVDQKYVNPAPPQVSQVLDVRFNLTIGIGQTAITIDGFEVYQFVATAPYTLIDHPFIYSTMVIAPERLQNAASQPGVNEIRNIVAENIQLNAVCNFSTGVTHGDKVTLELKTFFAPVTHIRPEWQLAHFPGEETGGS